MRLIDADELARSHCVECTYYHTGKCLGKECDWDSIGHIRDAKTIDAVPVVRCKDCIHRPIGDPHEHDVKPPKEEDYKCPCLCQDDSWYSWIPDDDWFCGNGETE